MDSIDTSGANSVSASRLVIQVLSSVCNNYLIPLSLGVTSLAHYRCFGQKCHVNNSGLDNLRASEPCEADVRGTRVSLKNTPVSLNSSPVSMFGSHGSHVWLACLARLARWLAHWPHSNNSTNNGLKVFYLNFNDQQAYN